MKGDEVCQEAQDLLRFDSDPGVLYHATEVGPTGRKDMAASLQIHEENLHKMKAEGEMDQVKGLESEEMCVGTKPLCSTMPEKPTNMGELLDLFPKLLSLHAQDLPLSVFSDTGDDKKLPVCEGSVYGSETLKDLVWKFLKQYYSIYDGGDRQSLLSAYHDNACFSLSTPFNPEEPSLVSWGKFSKDSRAMKQLKDVGLCVQVMKHTKREIVDFFRVLPKTQHDFSSFVVDMCVPREKMLCFSVGGKFKEVGGMCEARVCTFTRTFVLIPDSDSSLCIVKDQLTVTDVNPKEIQSTFFSPGPCFGGPPSQKQQ
ncbi:nuclear RNA export factor 3-like [Echinops telfairi]|uniref:Nuclear RNA export factor 3-like n=1 Tax=Echinops telfairi TaxID=9371 RepID=A0AC55D4S6_ECHTE|nr:nuclear RNA export factor 3-like [Echinops telfairi]